MPNAEIRAVVEWLIDGARSAPLPQQILAQLCDRLVACGIPLWRVAVLVRTLHPNVMGRRFVRRPDAEVEVREAPFELLETSDSLDSMIAHVYLTADPVRRRLAVPHPVLDFPILSELRAEGSRMPVDMWTIGLADRLRLCPHPHRHKRQPED
jgi:adenylate cyclase